MTRQSRLALMLSGAVDSLLGGITLLLYFGLLPLDISSWGIPRWALGLVGGVLFFSGIAVFTYFSTKTDSHE
jgi:integral membrane sensor domain MASE1